MSNPFAYDVFLSHNKKDKTRVRRLAERLRDAGLRVWFDDWVIQPGDDIYLAIEHGLEATRTLVLCLSPAALESDWVTLERSTVLFRDPSNVGRRFIPLLLVDCELPDTLRRYKYVDSREDTDEAFSELLIACRREQGQAVSQEEARNARQHLDERHRTSGTKQQRPIARGKRGAPTKTCQQVKPQLRCVLKGHTGEINRFSWSRDGTMLASPSDDGTIRIWQAESAKQLQIIKTTHSWVNCVTWSPKSDYLVAGLGDGSIRQYQIDHQTGTSKENWVARVHNGEVTQVALSPDGVRVASASKDGSLTIRRSSDGRPGDALPKPRVYAPSWVNSVAWSPNGKMIAAGLGAGAVLVWDISSGHEFEMSHSADGPVVGVAWSPRHEILASASYDKTVSIWDVRQRRQITRIEGHSAEVFSVSFSSDGAFLASKSKDHTVRIWDSSQWIPVVQLDAPFHTHVYNDVLFSPQSSVVAFVSQKDRVVCIWDLESVTPTAPAVEATHRYVNAKVVLIGEGAVGKTSLAHRLVEDRYVVQDRTHGMNVWRLALPLPSDSLLEREALLWDLAGQEDYRLIHQLFLEETALALLLINPQKDDPFAEVGDWLKALKTATNSPEARRDAARLLIFSQIDVGGMKVGNAKIERFRDQHGFAGWLATSAKTGENCSDEKNRGKPSKLKQLIAGNIPWDKLPWTSTPRLLAELKNAVVAMRDQTDIRLLRFAELAQRLEQALPGEKFGESDVRTAVTLLANHGLARPLKFGDLVLLRPDLLNGYAGAIIRAARAHKDEIGCVSEIDIYKPNFDFTGVERLKHRPDEELLLRAMVQTFLDNSLCIAEDTPQGRHLVFPSQYRREKDIPRDPDIFVSYTFSGEWQTVWTTLVVRLWYSQEFHHQELWRNAAEFASSRGHTLGLKIDHQQGEGEATVSLYFDIKVPDELKVIFIEYVHRHLATYACDVARDRRYVCPVCGKPVKDLDEVRKRLDAKKDFIYCQGCDEKVPLLDFIEQRLKSDPVARKILHMEETATRELDTQALEQILIGHMMAICGEANQVYRPVTMFDEGIDGEVEFKDKDGNPSGKKIYLQLKSGDSYLRTRKTDGKQVFDVKKERHLEYWVSQPVDVYLVIRHKDEASGQDTICWMNITRYLKRRKDKTSRQIVFDGEKLDAPAVWRVRDEFFPMK